MEEIEETMLRELEELLKELRKAAGISEKIVLGKSVRRVDPQGFVKVLALLEQFWRKLKAQEVGDEDIEFETIIAQYDVESQRILRTHKQVQP